MKGLPTSVKHANVVLHLLLLMLLQLLLLLELILTILRMLLHQLLDYPFLQVNKCIRPL